MENFTNENRYIRAKKEVECLKSFYNNLISYTIIVTALGILNYWQNSWHSAWFLWVAFGWGIGLVFHASRAFKWNPLFNKDWEDRKIKEFMNKQ